MPKHVAIIMDGNGRWAVEQGQIRLSGHRAGAKAVREIVTYARRIGLRNLTLFAFSSENWGRPAREVAGLMTLLGEYLVKEKPTMLNNSIEFQTIGDTQKLPGFVQERIREVKEATAGLDGMRLTLALSYGSRDEIVRAARSLAEQVKNGEVDVGAIDESLFETELDTFGTPDPDLLIRTSGEHRVSNFLLWQLAYAELYITETPWPAFGRAELDAAIRSYANRERRFGLTGAQLSDEAKPALGT